MRIIASVVLILLSSSIWAQVTDPSTHYFIGGKSIAPWTLGLQFGQVKLENNSGQTLKGALVVKPSTRNTENDVIHAKWTPKNIKNEWGSQNENVYFLTLSNTSNTIDLSSVKDQAALVFDVKIIKPPKKHVNLTMESNWDWKTRTSVPLKSALKKLPKNQWISFPVPLQCFDGSKFDFSKISSIFMLDTVGKMELELGDIRLAAYPADKVKCAKH